MNRDTLLILRFIARTGCRPGEACAALWETWEPRAHLIPETEQWWGLLKPEEHKTIRHGKKRKIAIPPLLNRAIARIQDRPGHHPEFIFAHRRGKGSLARGAYDATAGEPWNTTALDLRVRRWREQAEKAEVLWRKSGRDPWQPLKAKGDRRLILYGLRHRWYTDAIAAGVTADKIGAAGGTGGKTVESNYVAARDEQVIQTANAQRARVRTVRGQSGGS